MQGPPSSPGPLDMLNPVKLHCKFTVRGTGPDIFKLVHYEAHAVGKRTVCILLGCFLASCSLRPHTKEQKQDIPRHIDSLCRRLQCQFYFRHQRKYWRNHLRWRQVYWFYLWHFLPLLNENQSRKKTWVNSYFHYICFTFNIELVSAPLGSTFNNWNIYIQRYVNIEF